MSELQLDVSAFDKTPLDVSAFDKQPLDVSIFDKKPKENVPLWERFLREFGEGVGEFVKTWVPKSALDWLDKQSGEKVWDAPPLTTDMQEAETTGEKLVGLGGMAGLLKF